MQSQAEYEHFPIARSMLFHLQCLPGQFEMLPKQIANSCDRLQLGERGQTSMLRGTAGTLTYAVETVHHHQAVNCYCLKWQPLYVYLIAHALRGTDTSLHVRIEDGHAGSPRRERGGGGRTPARAPPPAGAVAPALFNGSIDMGVGGA